MRTFGSVLLVVLFLVAGTAQSQIIFSETFDYSKMGGLVDCSLMNLTSPYAPLANQSIGSPTWVTATTSAFKAPVLVDSAALTYTGYALSGMGRRIYLPSSDSSRQSARRQFVAQSGKVYYAMLVRLKEIFQLGTPYNGTVVDISKQDLNGTTIACVNSSTSSSGIRGLLVFNRADTVGGANAGKYVAGVSYKRDDVATTFSTKLLDTLQTYLMVVCTDVAGTTTKLWINPSLTGTEPTPDAICINTGGADAISLQYFTIYQRSEGPSGWISGLRVGAGWDAVSNISPLPLTETFTYTSGALCDVSATLNTTSTYFPVAANNVSGGVWLNGSTSKHDDPLLVKDTALTYAGYALSGQGKKVWCPNLAGNTSNNRASRLFTPQTGKVYYAAMVNLPTIADLSSSTSSGGEYLLGLYTNASFSTAAGRSVVTFRLSPTTGKYIIGIRASSTSVAGWVTAKDLDTTVTQLVVVSYELATATAQIWVNPVVGAVEPAPDATSNLGTTDTNTDLGRIGIYQRGTKPHAYVGGITVQTTWPVGPATSVTPTTLEKPTTLALLGNYPNPFNPSTKISFTVARAARARLTVYNVLGQQVATLFDQDAATGMQYEVSFDGIGLASGLYLARLESDGNQVMHKMLLMK
ncbi:MAG: T9SS type A sorting domain-containing protein [Ignavibacteriae bacterium]|nr:T9SS type A sorting domain-containing protein [Ignavibacteriota bacterium]